MRKINIWWKVIKKATKNFIANDPFSMGATIAFYTIFSLPAVSILAIEIASYFYEEATFKQELQYQLNELLGSSVNYKIDELLTSNINSKKSFVLQIIGVVTLIVSATTVFAALQSNLNKIWSVKPKPGKSIMNYIMSRFISLATITSMVFLLVISLLVESLIVVFSTYLTSFLPEISQYIIYCIDLSVSLGVYVLIFSFIFKVMPDAHTYWSDTRKGAIITALLFSLGKYGIGFYIGHSSLGNSYGAAGSLVGLLVWVYYSTIILLYGAQITHQFSLEKSGEIKPGKYAVAVETTEIER